MIVATASISSRYRCQLGTPCWLGHSPVAYEVSTVGVVDGYTVISSAATCASKKRRAVFRIYDVHAQPVHHHEDDVIDGADSIDDGLDGGGAGHAGIGNHRQGIGQVYDVGHFGRRAQQLTRVEGREKALSVAQLEHSGPSKLNTGSPPPTLKSTTDDTSSPGFTSR